ncbi:MAG TPA: MFS transporter [Candidatus Saccharimonadales bacterium]|nr:MFS transporter [Candidatus Saccharimonadales bacterium]
MATKTHISAQDSAAGFSNKMRTVALVVVALAFVMDLLDSTIVNIAIPSIQTNLGASYSAIQWLVAGYALAFALLLVTGGRMGDVFGYKKLFMIGVGGFTIASLFSGLAWSPNALIFARLLQGSMAALMVPQVMSLMQVMYKPQERGAINGLFGALGGMAASLGPIIGGVLIKANLFGWDWRPIFLINVPIGLFGLLAAAKYLPDGKSSHPLKLDISGTFIIILAMSLFIFPLIQGRELGWPKWSLAMIVASLPVFALFAWWQKRKERVGEAPLILPALFKSRSFGTGLMMNLIFEAAMIGFFLTFGLLLQIGLGYTPIHAALTGLPVAFGIAFTMATMGEKVIPKLGRYAFHIGTVTMALGLGITSLIFHHYVLDTHSWQLIFGLLCIGIGMGFVFSSLFAAVLNGVDASHAGSASGTLNAVQQIGGAIGIALIGLIFFGQLSHGAATSFSAVEPHLRQELTAQHIPDVAQEGIIQGLKTCFVDRSKEKDSTVIPESCNQTQTMSVSSTLQNTLTTTARRANATNFTTAFRWSSLFNVSLLAVTFSLAFLLPARFRSEAYSEAA